MQPADVADAPWSAVIHHRLGYPWMAEYVAEGGSAAIESGDQSPHSKISSARHAERTKRRLELPSDSSAEAGFRKTRT